MPSIISLMSHPPRFSAGGPRISHRNSVPNARAREFLERVPHLSNCELAEKLITNTTMSDPLRALALRFVIVRHGNGSKKGLRVLKEELFREAMTEFQNATRAGAFVQSLEKPNQVFNAVVTKKRQRRAGTKK